MIPVNVLVILMIMILVLIAVFAGIIAPAISGRDEANRGMDFTLLCNEWDAKNCGDNYYFENEERIKKIANCANMNECKGKCERSGFCKS